ncbi:MAG: flagellar motor protein MotA [Candidatus Marinimicrobia bacterium]|nr:flagellar motor protein MotA [Candidatus Neomarinimicrobiota bacterium]|tara:strand:+ start:13132 stop:13740 length:609 start_codon:yes stop_codon:yes gene_type:complete
MVEFFVNGGSFMWPILGILIVGLAFVGERLYHLMRALKTKDDFAVSLASTIKEKGFDDAKTMCDKELGPIANLCYNALEVAQEGTEAAEKKLQQTAGIELASLEKNMTWISFCIATAPMLGFLGTIAGMIVAFADIAAAENISPKIVADGIGQALYTTAFGLVVAVIIQFGQNIVMFIIDNMVVSIQKSTTIVLQSIADKNK